MTMLADVINEYGVHEEYSEQAYIECQQALLNCAAVLVFKRFEGGVERAKQLALLANSMERVCTLAIGEQYDELDRLNKEEGK